MTEYTRNEVKNVTITETNISMTPVPDFNNDKMLVENNEKKFINDQLLF